MIKLFRKIRQRLLTENKLSKYLIYAIGEIVLVVIGILIALQVNNWNENRKKTDLADTYRWKLIEELETDIKLLSYLDSMNSIYTTRILKHLNNYESSDKIETLPIKQSKENYVIAAFYSNTYTINTLINTGELSLLQDSEIQLIIKLKGELEKYGFYEKTEIDAVNSDFQNIKSQFDLISKYGYSSDIENYESVNQYLNLSQYQKYKNYLAELLNLYKMQSDIYAVIKKLSKELVFNLKTTKG